jgi:RHS repeat-associated protein
VAEESAIAFASRQPADLALPLEVTADPRTGAALITVGIPTSPARSLQPTLALAYSSAGRNSPFGLGWSLSGVPSVTLSTREGLPRYDGRDRYAFGGVDLVPVGAGAADRVLETGGHWVHVYRPRVEAAFTRFERWVEKATGREHWRARDRNDVVSIFGRGPGSDARIADPEADERTFAWLLERQHDAHGNAVRYEYAAENAIAVSAERSFERGRAPSGRFAQRHLRAIRYGNTAPVGPDDAEAAAEAWLFSLVFDYGERAGLPSPPHETDRPWPARLDPYSTYSTGFDVRTHRLCRQVLQFHHFPQELGEPATLVGALSLEHDERPSGSVLRALRYAGHRRDQPPRQLPPLTFHYTEAERAAEFTAVAPSAGVNAPAGVEAPHRLVDLFGDGLPGILYEGGCCWLYKENQGGGSFGPQRPVWRKPSLAPGSYALGDFDGDGNLDVLVLQGREAGHFSLDRETRSWTGFRSLASAPRGRTFDRYTQLLDLDGDGLADIVTVEAERLTWCRSRGRDGFDPPVELARPRGAVHAPMVGADPRLDYFFADMTGDGLLDQVRVSNGSVAYWPQLGHGRFGERVVMEDAPALEFDGIQDAGRVRLVDLDGNGTADLLYIGRGEIRYWLNAGGNRFLEGGRIGGLPYIDDLDGVSLGDFLGDGTACLVWSTALPSASASLQYLQLTRGPRPGLLNRVESPAGRETLVTYGHSARHYLRDVRNGRDWRTRLPTHTAVVDRIAVLDLVGDTRSETSFEYHDGFFDGDEREFRGFGLVDRYDVDVSRARGAEADDVRAGEPVCVRTWLHSGDADGDRRRAADFYAGDPAAAVLASSRIEDVERLDAEEFTAAYRALAGQVVRTETYGVDPGGRRRDHPYQVSQRGYRVRRLSARTADRDPSFATVAEEVLTYVYEQDPADPRITHSVTLDVDEYGNVTRLCDLAYPRRASRRIGVEAQARAHAVVTTTALVNVDDVGRHRLGIPAETRTYEVAGLLPAAVGGADAVFTVAALARSLAEALAEARVLRAHESFTAGTQARLARWERQYYWSEDRAGPLPLGAIGEAVLLHHDEAACFTSALVEAVFAERVTAAMVESEGYALADEHWWRAGPTRHYLPRAGFDRLARVVTRLRREAGEIEAVTSYEYDRPHYLLVTSETDAVGNRAAAVLVDYHVLAPARIVDANDNVSEVLYDALGVAVVSTEHGRILGRLGREERFGHEPLERYVPPPPASVADVLADPAPYLQGAGSYLQYSLDTWTGPIPRPPCTVSLTRENYRYDGEGSPPSEAAIRVHVSYLDGFGRVLQLKEPVDPGPVLYGYDADGRALVDRAAPVHVARRWRASGRTVFDRKQQAVMQYEPFFSSTHEFEGDPALARFGETSVTTYDALGRPTHVLHPNLTVERVEFSAWTIRRHDANDTVAGSGYEIARALYPDDDPEKLALRGAQAHAGTPAEVHLDPRAREVVLVESGGADGLRRTETRLDWAGQPESVVDPRGLVAFRYRRDLLGRVMHSRSADAGERWTLFDAQDQATRSWDGRGVGLRAAYDRLGRSLSVRATDAHGLDSVVERHVYGDEPEVEDAALRNLRGRAWLRYDQAGVRRVHGYDAAGNVLHADRRLCADYKGEPDWTDPGVVPLDTDVFASRFAYDALGRLTRQELPDGTTRRFDYVAGGWLRAVRLSTADAALLDEPFLADATYDPGGRRTQAVLGGAAGRSAIVVDRAYDLHTHRLARVLAQERTASGPGRVYQDLRCAYDPMGNIVHAVDRAQEPPGSVFTRLPPGVDAVTRFRYDAFYRLREATGRVHRALERNDDDPRREGPGLLKGARHLTFENMEEVRRCRQEYGYDAAGNLQHVIHTTIGLAGPADEPNRRWRQDYWISGTSNRSLPAEDLNGLPPDDPESRFDENGNALYLPYLRGVAWSYRGKLARAVQVRREDGRPDDAEYYVYNGDGLRARKVLERVLDEAGTVEIVEKIYLDGCEVKRIRTAERLLLERWTSHVTDGNARLALLHQWTVDERSRETADVAEKRVHFQLANALGSAVLEVNEHGDVITYEEYFPFGGTAFLAGPLREVRLKDYRYSAKERDDATGLYDYGHRYYAPWLRRWLTPDPLGPVDGPNLYVFARDNPVTFRDPNGLDTLSEKQVGDLFARFPLQQRGSYELPEGGMVEEFSGSRLEAMGTGPGNVVRLEVTVRIRRSEQGRFVSAESAVTSSPTDLTAVWTIEGTVEFRGPGQAPAGPAPSRSPQRRAHARAAPPPPQENPDTETPEARGTEAPPPAEDPDAEQVQPEMPPPAEQSIANEVPFEDPEAAMTRLGVEDNASQRSFVPDPPRNPPAGAPEEERGPGIYRPYGGNEHANYAAGVGDSFIDMSGTRNIIDRWIDAYVRGGEGIDGFIAARETTNDYLVDKYLTRPYESGGGGLEGGRRVAGHALTEFNPLIPMYDGAVRANREHNGGLEGTLAAIDALNPFAHIRDALSAAWDAIERGDAHGAGYHVTSAEVQIAGVVEGFRSAGTMGPILSRAARRSATQHVVTALRSGSAPSRAVVEQLATTVRREIRAEMAAATETCPWGRCGDSARLVTRLEEALGEHASVRAVQLTEEGTTVLEADAAGNWVPLEGVQVETSGAASHALVVGRTAEGQFFIFDPTVTQFTTEFRTFGADTTRNAAFLRASQTPGHFVAALHGESGLAFFGSRAAFERALVSYRVLGERLRFDVAGPGATLE